MKNRTLHPKKTRFGTCKRCGLSSGEQCPAGFWMTRAETAHWHNLSTLSDRAEFEKRLACLASQPNGVEQEKKT